MSLLDKLGLGPKEAAAVIVDTAKAGADIVERWHPSDAAKHEQARENLADAEKATASARSYNPVSAPVGTGLLATVAAATNVFVDALNRLIRPGVALLLIGGVFGMWDLSVTTKDPIVLGWAESVVGFYFGVRAITQDLPRLIAALKLLRSK